MKTNFKVEMNDPDRCEIREDFQAIHEHGTKAGAICGSLGAILLIAIWAFVRWVKGLFKENQKLKNQYQGS